LDGINLFSLLPIKCNPKVKINTITEYSAKLVKVKVKYPNIGNCKLIIFVTSNCSKGELLKILDVKMVDIYVKKK
jgi:hypothetical protein